MDKKIKIVVLYPIILGMVLFLFMGAMAPPATDLSIVVNSGVQETVSYQEFIRIIRGEKQRWDDGTKVSIALMKTSHPTGQLTAERIYAMSGNELNKYWLSVVFQGKAKAPNFFNSEPELINYVSTTPGAIGIVSAGTEGNFKILTITGTEKL
ncbi:MAG: hypothetical protein WD077_01395 [Bacteroidia bacterium]